ncbi:aldo/keto reductase [bacterium]|nr:aldo/keto reductase [bacterium]
MQGSKISNLNISPMTLGTVQFGLDYGIANTSGKPSYETARDIIACAYEGGITCLDTAALYGESETVLGKALAELKISDEITVATKVCHIADDLSMAEADSIVEKSVMQSLANLRIEAIPICLFHTENNFLQYAESLRKLKEKGLVERIGSSVNTPDGAYSVVTSGLSEAMQMPSSVLDHRFVRKGICSEAARRGTALFVRSVYLQGLILMPEKDILPELADVIPIRRKLCALACQAGITPAELAVRYMLGVEGITSLVIGVDSVQQMHENISLFAKGPLDDDLQLAVTQAVPDLSDKILFPGNWSKRMADAKPEK